MLCIEKVLPYQQEVEILIVAIFVITGILLLLFLVTWPLTVYQPISSALVGLLSPYSEMEPEMITYTGVTDEEKAALWGEKEEEE